VKVLVVGAGGREHALARALARSPQRPELLCAPGNAGIARDARVLGIAADDLDGLAAAVEREDVELTVIGPEVPLVAGLVDLLRARGHRAFGPTAAAARLEGSKAYAKRAMDEAGVPTARWRHVGSLREGEAAIAELGGGGRGVVIKADGLAAGKGVTVAEDVEQAKAALREIFVEGRFAGTGVPAASAAPARAGDTAATSGQAATDATGAPAASAVVEERLNGQELSLLALCDGERALAMAPARDFKRIGEGNTGPNTGGMGSYSPVAGFDAARARELAAAVHQPIVELMRARGAPFSGVLYAGLMLTEDGPRVLEFNVRFGDPETQAVLPRLRSDLLELLLAATRPGGLAGVELEWAPEWAVTVVLASAGYPASARSGDPIAGLPEAAGGGAHDTARASSSAVGLTRGGVEITHAGTALDPGGALVTAGGRVLNVTGIGADVDSARQAAYAGAEMISFEGMQMRRDIAAQAAENGNG
jgi:phosphoribosylamine---glycine ligase